MHAPQATPHSWWYGAVAHKWGEMHDMEHVHTIDILINIYNYIKLVTGYLPLHLYREFPIKCVAHS